MTAGFLDCLLCVLGGMFKTEGCCCLSSALSPEIAPFSSVSESSREANEARVWSGNEGLLTMPDSSMSMEISAASAVYLTSNWLGRL